MRVKALIKNANPVPDASNESLSARAADELAALVGSGGVPPATAACRPSRRPFLMAAVSCGAAIAIGGATFFSIHSDPAGPGSHHAGPGRGPGGDAMADEPYYGSTAKLEGVANVIVRARLDAGHEEDVDGVSTTVAPAKVVATAKGDTSGGAIQVSYTTPGSGPETAGFTAGQEYVLLLRRGEGGRYFLVNTTQGWYEVENGAAASGKDNHVSLSSGVRKALRLNP